MRSGCRRRGSVWGNNKKYAQGKKWGSVEVDFMKKKRPAQELEKEIGRLVEMQ